MAKRNESDKREIKLGVNDLSKDSKEKLYSLTKIISYLDGMKVKDIISVVEFIQAECGEDAVIDVEYNDYWGSSEADIKWSRLETDDEVKNRMTKSAKQKKTATANRKLKKAQKVVDDKAELARLRKLYPNG